MSTIESYKHTFEMTQKELFREQQKVERYYRRLDEKVKELLDDEDFITEEFHQQKLWIELSAIAKGDSDAIYKIEKGLKAAARDAAKRTVEWNELED